MKKATLILLILLLPAVPAFAVTIEFDPSISTVDLADVFDIDILISDLGEEIVSAFDLDVTYDDSILTATAVTFGPELGGGTPLSLQSFDLSMPGLVDLAEVSILPDPALAATQADTFVLATISFAAVGLGTSPLVLEFTPGVIGLDSMLLDLAPATGGVTVVDGVPIPVPATWLLVAGGLWGASIARRRP